MVTNKEKIKTLIASTKGYILIANALERGGLPNDGYLKSIKENMNKIQELKVVEEQEKTDIIYLEVA